MKNSQARVDKLRSRSQLNDEAIALRQVSDSLAVLGYQIRWIPEVRSLEET